MPYGFQFLEPERNLMDKFVKQTKEYPAVCQTRTKKMIVPSIPEGQFIFELRDMPGVIHVGSQGHFTLREVYGYGPRLITFEDTVQWLNREYLNTGKKATIRYCKEWKDTDQAMLEKLLRYQIALVDSLDDDVPIIVEIDADLPPIQTKEDLAMVGAALKEIAER